MKIVITGASGFVGQLLVPYLKAAGADLLLVGRSPSQLSTMFPTVPNCTYSRLDAEARGFDKLVHLAVANSDCKLTEAEVFATNVDFLLTVARQARQAGITQFINVSSIHALDYSNNSAYARSKRAAALSLGAIDALELHTVYLPLVYGEKWAGKLGILNKLPALLRRPIFTPFAALRPTVHVKLLSNYILDSSQDTVKANDIILADQKEDNPFFTCGKRLLDLVFVASVGLIFGWLMIIVWVAIRLDSHGPGIYAQTRVGKNEKYFTCYKFRTMKQNTEQAGTHEISVAAVTRIGAVLRRTKFDELPQIWNILRNEMSLVGPRPCLPIQKELLSTRRKLRVFDVIPGVSGLAQINDIDMSDPNRLAQWDSQYISLRSLLSDISIIVATATGRGRGDRTSCN